jgi:hypothetical protein
MSIGKIVQKFRRNTVLQTLGHIQNNKISCAVYILKTDAILSTEMLVKFDNRHGVFLLGAGAPIGPGPPHYRGFTITLSYKHHIGKGFLWTISQTQISPPETHNYRVRHLTLPILKVG